MELNLMSTDTVYPNINIVFDDSIFAVDDDRAFVCSVGQRFNSTITFPSYADSIRIGGTPSQFNCPLTIPNNVTNVSSLFLSCSNFNQPVIIPNKVNNCMNMFKGCLSFNQPLTIPNSVKIMSYMLYGCNSFNQPLTIPNSVTACGSIFASSTYNNIVTIEEGTLYVGSLFQSAIFFNSPVNIPDSVITANSMFQGANSFNQPVNFGNNITNLTMAFQSATNFNSPVQINNATLLYSMFYGCYFFNYPINIPEGVTNCGAMFSNVTMYNSSVIIPGTVKDCSYMFSGVNSCPYNVLNTRFGPTTNNALMQPIYVNMTNVTTTQYMFQYCNSMRELYIKNMVNNYQMNYMLRNNGSFRLNIYTDDDCMELMRTAPMLVNLGKPTWTEDATNNCIYNTVVNIYIYNTWNGVVPDFS